MKVTIDHIPEGRESEIIIRYSQVDDSIRKLLHFLKHPTQELIGEINEEKHILEHDKIFYLESMDHKVYIHGEQGAMRPERNSMNCKMN